MNSVEKKEEDYDQEEENDPVSISTVTASLQHLLKIRKVLLSYITSLKHAEKMLYYVKKIKTFLLKHILRILNKNSIFFD